jgi:tripartite-type tricarboxylate transporter receptor subunit TctC
MTVDFGKEGRELVLLTVALAFYCLGVSPAWAQPYPNKPVRIIVPLAAGGPADVNARFIAERLRTAFGQPFVIDNRPGATTIIGTDIAAKSPADGYTLLLMGSVHTGNESMPPKKPYTLMKDFTAVAPINSSDLVLVVHPSVPSESVKELVQLAKSKPGVLNYASSGTGSPFHVAAELFKAMAQVDIVHVPHKGSDGARTSVIGGQVQVMFDAITSMAPMVRAGRVRALGTSGLKRSVIMPELPTISEAGVEGYETTIWFGLMAPAGTPQPIIDRLNSEITKITSLPDVRAAWAEVGSVPMSMTPTKFGKYIHDDIAKWRKVIEASGVRPDR